MTYTIPDKPVTQRLYNQRRQAFYAIRDLLPPPFEETPESYRERDLAVIESINHLLPASAIEADLAAMAVAGNRLWIHYSRAARRNEDDEKKYTRFAAQAARSARDAKGYLIALERVQKMRIQRESTLAGVQRAEIIEDNGRIMLLAALDDPPKGVQPQPATAAAPGAVAAGLVAETAVEPPADTLAPAVETAAEPRQAASPPEPAPEPALATPIPPVDAPEPATATPIPPVDASTTAPDAPAPHLAPVERIAPYRRARGDDWPEPNTVEPDWAEAAERYALIHPDRARLIRDRGGVPEGCRFAPPEDALVRAIIAGATPRLLALDDALAGQRQCA